MQKVSYMGNDETTEFYFNFPYFETSNVVVTKNGTPATGCNIIGNSGGLDADYPYIGGKVVFDIAPTSLESITIARQLPLARIADYQPLAQIPPTTLNQDLNYLMEVIKDRKDELTDLITKYSEIADKESTEIILARISAIHEEITDIDAKIRALGDIGTLQQRVTDLTTTVGGHTTSIASLDTKTDSLDTQKSNIDMNNLSNTGKNEIAHMSMPSDRRINLSLGASGSQYTAPADGFIYFERGATSGDKYISLFNTSSGMSSAGITISGISNAKIFLPVKKSDVFRASYNADTENPTFQFIYVEGAQ